MDLVVEGEVSFTTMSMTAPHLSLQVEVVAGSAMADAFLDAFGGADKAAVAGLLPPSVAPTALPTMAATTIPVPKEEEPWVLSISYVGNVRAQR